MNLTRNDVNYIEKVLRIYGDLNGELHLVELQRNRASSSLGLSLVGNRDIATMGVFVFDIEPLSLVGLDGRIRVGDELLEINGHVLYGRSHLNASAIIKGINASILKILLLRDNEFLQRIAVEPVTRKMLKYADSATTLIPKRLKEQIENDTEGENENNFDDSSPLIVSSVDSPIERIPSANDLPDIVATGQKTISCDISRSHNDSSIKNSTEVENDSLKQGDEISAKKFRLKIINASDCVNESQLKEFGDNGISLWINDKLKSNHIEGILQDASADKQLSVETVASDPLTCSISVGKPSVIDIPKGKEPLGVQVIGGSDTTLNPIYIFQIYKDGAAFRDGRLAVGDLILEAHGEDLTNVTNFQAHQILQRSCSTLRLVVLRDAFQEDDLYDNLTVELFKKPGKGLGFSIVSRRDDRGVLIADIIKGGVAEFDGRLMVGDEIISVNGHNTCDVTRDDAAYLLKMVIGQVSLSVRRLRVGLRPTDLVDNSYGDICPEGNLKKPEFHTTDCKNATKKKQSPYRSVATCLKSPDD